MQETREDLIRQLGEQERLVAKYLPPRPLPDLPTIDYTKLVEAPPDSPIAMEWNFYRREVARLLAEGHEGKWVLIKSEQIIGLYETHEEACEAQHVLKQAAVMKQILRREPVIRIGYIHVCDARQLTLPWFSHASVLVMDLPLWVTCDVLIGMDILIACKTIVDGPAGSFTIEF